MSTRPSSSTPAPIPVDVGLAWGMPRAERFVVEPWQVAECGKLHGRAGNDNSRFYFHDVFAFGAQNTRLAGSRPLSACRGRFSEYFGFFWALIFVFGLLLPISAECASARNVAVAREQINKSLFEVEFVMVALSCLRIVLVSSICFLLVGGNENFNYDKPSKR